MSKKLLFLYPVEEYWLYSFPFYSEQSIELLEKAIDCRYRKKGYEIYYAMFPDREIKHIHVLPTDRVIYTDISFAEHTTATPNGFAYPAPHKLIDQLGQTEHLVVCGFHSCDCVRRIAQEGIDRKLDTLVDIELTELFSHYSSKFYFDPEQYNLANMVMAAEYENSKYHPYLSSMLEKYDAEYYHLKDFVPTITIEDIEANEISLERSEVRVV